jgi:hypothetical protein
MIRFCPRLWLLMIACLVVPCMLAAQEGELDKSPPKNLTVEEIVLRFTTREKQWKQFRQQYKFRQEVKVQTLNGDQVVGEYRRVDDIRYAGGKRIKSAVFAPQASAQLSPEDVEDLETRASFTIGADDAADYNLVYAGQQQEDALHCYAFDVSPKSIEKNRRYFEGRIWVDDHDFQIVKLRGKSVPDIRIQKKKKLEENLFPQYTTYRQMIDGYWFPTFSSADDTLHFSGGDVRLKQVLKFTGYQRVEGGQEKAPSAR